MSRCTVGCVLLSALLGVGVMGACNSHGGSSASQTQTDWAARRDHMVRTQIEARGVKDPQVLASMNSVPRHLFVTTVNRRITILRCRSARDRPSLSRTSLP